VFGAYVIPLRAAFKLATVPDTVNVAEPLTPVVKLNPVVEPRESFPCETDSERESALTPAAASVTEIALLLPLEKTSELFSVTDAVPGAVIAGAARALTVSETLVELDSELPGLETETPSESAPV
jgi:hypothetical protein